MIYQRAVRVVAVMCPSSPLMLPPHWRITRVSRCILGGGHASRKMRIPMSRSLCLYILLQLLGGTNRVEMTSRGVWLHVGLCCSIRSRLLRVVGATTERVLHVLNEKQLRDCRAANPHFTCCTKLYCHLYNRSNVICFIDSLWALRCSSRHTT